MGDTITTVEIETEVTGGHQFVVIRLITLVPRVLLHITMESIACQRLAPLQPLSVLRHTMVYGNVRGNEIMTGTEITGMTGTTTLEDTPAGAHLKMIVIIAHPSTISGETTANGREEVHHLTEAQVAETKGITMTLIIAIQTADLLRDLFLPVDHQLVPP